MQGECGTVIEVRGNRALLSAAPNAGCSSCALKDSCMLGGDDRKRKIWVGNTLGARPGDTVEFAVRAQAVVRISLLLYLVPVIMMIGGITAGFRLNHYMGLDKDLSGALWGLAGLILAFAAIRVVSGIWQRHNTYEPVMIRIISDDGKNFKSTAAKAEIE